MARLLRKWLDIVLHSSCYYPLETVLVTGIGLPDIEDFKEQTPNEEGYYLEFPMEFINNMDELSDLVFQKTFGTMRFCSQHLIWCFILRPAKYTILSH